MKRIISFLIISFTLLLSSCSTDTPVSPKEAEEGAISLNIDRMHKPENVVSVTAYLTREGYDTLSGTLNLLSDTTADITFNDITAGGWHLKVDAADEENVVVYTGERDVNILAGITTQVYLTLEPTGAGVGNIYIYVTWGVPPNTDWVDYSYNPILSPSLVPDGPAALLHPKVLYEDGIFKMWFTSVYNSAVSNVWYALSNDGKTWNLGNSSPVLNYGSIYQWDSHAVESGPVIKVDNEYRMYYLGFSDEYGYWNIGLATSPDGVNWIKYPDPVLYADPYSEFQIVPNDIIKINDTYNLYYTVRQYPYYEIRLATSQDGINFTKFNGNPIMIADLNWEDSGVAVPSVIYDNNQYKMIYMNGSGNGFGMAYSTDGINWAKDPDNPFFGLDEVHNNWCYKITYPFWRKINGQYRIYYTGNTYGSYEAGIGLIYK
jgi:predicted GH43/DUF377 family glycosyl hydrolase